MVNAFMRRMFLGNGVWRCHAGLVDHEYDVPRELRG